MEQQWTKKFDKCQQCGTSRFDHKAKGLCTRCHSLVKRLEQVERWNLQDPKSLKGYPGDTRFEDPDAFKKIKSGFSSQIRERMQFLRDKEKMLEGPIDGLTIEFQLGRIARRCGVQKPLFHGMANTIDWNFEPKQKKILYRLLNEIEENIRWKGPDLMKVFGFIR